MGRGRNWQPKEVAALKRYYRTSGPAAVQKALTREGFTRSIDSIRHQAHKLGIQFGASQGYVLLNVVHPITQSKRSAPSLSAIARAKADGVLVVRKSGTKRVYSVPEAWADEYTRELGERIQADRLEGYWPRTREIAEWFGLIPQQVLNARCVNLGLLSELVRGIETRRGSGRQLYWHPEQARTAARRYRLEWRPRNVGRKLTVAQVAYARRERAQGRSIKSLADELGVGIGTVQRLLDGRTYQDVERAA
jgi:hypothetical protein